MNVILHSIGFFIFRIDIKKNVIVLLSIVLASLSPQLLQAQTSDSNFSEQDEQAEAHLRLGIDFFLTNELEIAIDEFQEAARLRSGYADAYHNLGVALAKNGDLTGAIAAWSQAQRLDPDAVPVQYHISALVSYNYGVALLQQGRLDRAMTEWESAQRIQPNFAEAHYAEGLGYLAQGRALQAIAKLHQTLSWRPNWAMAHHQLGVAYYENREFRLAETSWHTALELQPGLSKTHANLGLIRLIEGDVALAIKAFRQAITLDADLPEAHFNLGMAFYSKGEWHKALEPFQKVLAIHPESLTARQMLGATWANLGHWDKAVREWREALQTHPADSAAAHLHYNTGLALFMMGDIRGALRELRQTVALQPEWAEAHYQLGTLSMLAKKWEIGLTHFQKTVELEPSWAKAFFSLGKVQYQMGDVTQAIESLRQATELEPQFPDASYHLGVMLRAQNRSEAAIAPLQIAAKAGIEDAQGLLASMYANGSGVDQNIPMAMIWWARASSALSSSEVGRHANEKLSELRRQLAHDQLSSSQKQEILTGFLLIRRSIRQTVRNIDGYPFDQSLGYQLIQHGRISEAVPVLIQEALALDDLAHRKLERLYLSGIDGKLHAYDERILDYFIQTAREKNSDSCAFLKKVSLYEDLRDSEKIQTWEQVCHP